MSFNYYIVFDYKNLIIAKCLTIKSISITTLRNFLFQNKICIKVKFASDTRL